MSIMQLVLMQIQQDEIISADWTELYSRWDRCVSLDRTGIFFKTLKTIGISPVRRPQAVDESLTTIYGGLITCTKEAYGKKY